MTRPLTTEEPCECESLKHGSGLAAGEVIPPPTMTSKQRIFCNDGDDFAGIATVEDAERVNCPVPGAAGGGWEYSWRSLGGNLASSGKLIK